MTKRYHLTTVLLGMWIVLGMFLDATAHNNPDLVAVESFFSPWHAVFYSGFLTTSAWIAWPVLRNLRAGRTGLAAIPVGYDLGILGLAVFVAGAIGDMLWHTVFGLEAGTEALLSPTHAFIFLGCMLILTSPFRAAWATAGHDGDAPSLGAFLPTLLSITFTISVVSFAFLYVWAFFPDQHKMHLNFWWLLRDVAQPDTATFKVMQDVTARSTVGSILLSNLVVLAPILLMLRRWHLPFGSVTIFFMVTAVGFYELIPVALIAGLAADGLIRVLRPSPNRLAALRVFAALLPPVLWSLFFLALYIKLSLAWSPHVLAAYAKLSLAWSPEVLGGVLVWAGISGFGLSVVIVPARVPEALTSQSRS